MLLRSLLLQHKLWKKFRRIRRGKARLRDLPPYERGLYYEEFVCKWLKKRGYHILDRNFEGKKRCEIDIVAKDGKTLVFVEVKARRRNTVYSPLRGIDSRKRGALYSASSEYLQKLKLCGVDIEDLDVRYDVAALTFDPDGTPCSLDYYISYLEPSRENL